MVEETFDVYIENQDGEVIVDKEMKTFKNGFFDLWLPREQTYNVTVKHDGKIAEQKFLRMSQMELVLPQCDYPKMF